MNRPFIAFLLIFSLFFSSMAYSQVKQVKQPSNLNMRGAYTLQKQTLDSGAGPGVMNVQQLKIYTDKYFMYAHRASETDSLAMYGIGTYSVKEGKVIENGMYGSAGPDSGRYELAINTEPEGYSQVINFPSNDPGKTYVLTEDYVKNNRKMVSPLDGAWKQTKVIEIAKDGKATTNDSPTQFKIFESGHYMWANTSKDKDGKLTSYYGYGTFEMPRPNQIVETTTSSSFASSLVGTPVTVNIRLMGKDKYEQTITWPDGSKLIETYQRMK
jgi:hypothetical protein